MVLVFFLGYVVGAGIVPPLAPVPAARAGFRALKRVLNLDFNKVSSVNDNATAMEKT